MRREVGRSFDMRGRSAVIYADRESIPLAAESPWIGGGTTKF